MILDEPYVMTFTLKEVFLLAVKESAEPRFECCKSPGRHEEHEYALGEVTATITSDYPRNLHFVYVSDEGGECFEAEVNSLSLARILAIQMVEHFQEEHPHERP